MTTQFPSKINKASLNANLSSSKCEEVTFLLLDSGSWRKNSFLRRWKQQSPIKWLLFPAAKVITEPVNLTSMSLHPDANMKTRFRKTQIQTQDPLAVRDSANHHCVNALICVQKRKKKKQKHKHISNHNFNISVGRICWCFSAHCPRTLASRLGWKPAANVQALMNERNKQHSTLIILSIDPLLKILSNGWAPRLFLWLKIPSHWFPNTSRKCEIKEKQNRTLTDTLVKIIGCH